MKTLKVMSFPPVRESRTFFVCSDALLKGREVPEKGAEEGHVRACAHPWQETKALAYHACMNGANEMRDNPRGDLSSLTDASEEV